MVPIPPVLGPEGGDVDNPVAASFGLVFSNILKGGDVFNPGQVKVRTWTRMMRSIGWPWRQPPRVKGAGGQTQETRDRG